jgi:ParB-like chromosome segregation protein Spo0J
MNLIEVDLEKIRPNLRAVYHKETLEMLCHFINRSGQVDPIQVWFDGEGFRIWDGEKRWRVCKMMGIPRVKVIILEFYEDAEFRCLPK